MHLIFIAGEMLHVGFDPIEQGLQAMVIRDDGHLAQLRECGLGLFKLFLVLHKIVLFFTEQIEAQCTNGLIQVLH